MSRSPPLPSQKGVVPARTSYSGGFRNSALAGLFPSWTSQISACTRTCGACASRALQCTVVCVWTRISSIAGRRTAFVRVRLLGNTSYSDCAGHFLRRSAANVGPSHAPSLCAAALFIVGIASVCGEVTEGSVAFVELRMPASEWRLRRAVGDVLMGNFRTSSLVSCGTTEADYSGRGSRHPARAFECTCLYGGA